MDRIERLNAIAAKNEENEQLKKELNAQLVTNAVSKLKELQPRISKLIKTYIAGYKAGFKNFDKMFKVKDGDYIKFYSLNLYSAPEEVCKLYGATQEEVRRNFDKYRNITLIALEAVVGSCDKYANLIVYETADCKLDKGEWIDALQFFLNNFDQFETRFYTLLDEEVKAKEEGDQTSLFCQFTELWNTQKEKNPKLCRVTSEALCAFLLKAEEKFNKEKLDVNDRKVVEKFFQENVRDKF